MNIYRSFEQWKNGGFLEHGAPRTEEYTAEELHLVEMGWNYGYDAGRAVEQALDKKAENARELGLSYDDAVKGGVGIMLGGKRIDPASIYAEPKIGCVNHDCAQCKAVAWPRPEDQPIDNGPDFEDGPDEEGFSGPRPWNSFAQTAPVQDAEGENKAVRFFLMLYGQPGLTVGQMKGHMRMSGFKMWPAWVDTEPDGAHLTKAGAQLWIRHLFALEPTAPQPVPVKTYHDGKPWPVAPKPWVGLTDEEMEKLSVENGKATFLNDDEETDVLWFDGDCFALLKAAEAKLKEKNHG
jgi:hypothetical protein